MRAALGLALGLLAAACAPVAVSRVPPLDDPDQMVRDAEARQREGTYPAAIRGFEEVVRRFPGSPARDRALYGLGRILVAADNGGRDYRQALGYFNRLVREYPSSPYAAEARAWQDLLEAYTARIQEIERLKRIDVEMEAPRR